MAGPPIENDAARRSLEDATARLAALLGGVSAPETPIPNSDWTIREAAVHVLASLTDYGDALAGIQPLPALDPTVGPINKQTGAVNAERMRTVAHHDLPTLIAMIQDAIRRFLDGTAGRSGDDPFDWHGKQTSTLAGMTGIMVGEMLLHGYDIARAVRVSWPISPGDATMVALGGLALLPAFVDPDATRGVRASYEIAFRGGPKVGVRFDDGAATVEYPPRGPVDCRLSADPVAMLLVSYGRIGPAGPALRGKIVAYGRKPWLGFKFPKLILNP